MPDFALAMSGGATWRLRQEWRKVKVDDHAEAVLEAAQRL